MAKPKTTPTPTPPKASVAPAKPTMDDLAQQRAKVKATSDELNSALRQLRSAHSFNDADERNRRVDLAESRLLDARSAHDAALAEWSEMKMAAYS